MCLVWMDYTPAPDLFGDLDHARELDPLVGFLEVVAMRGRGEAALMGERALLERHIFRRLVDALFDEVLGLGGGLLRAHEPEHDGRALRREAQRREVARALVVIFEEEAVDLHLVEQDLGDRLIAALRDPRALEIAAAEMDADGHVGGLVSNRIVDEPAIEPRQRVRVVAARFRSGANVGIAEISEIGVVELQIAQAAAGEIGDFRAIGGGEIVVESLELRIDMIADRLAPAAEMQHRRRRNAHFRRAGRGLLEEIEVRSLNRPGPLHLAVDMHGRRRETNLRAVALLEVRRELAVADLDPVQPLQKIDVKVGAAKLAVGDPLETHILLGAHDLADALVLDCVQFGRGKMASGEAIARFSQPLGAKEAADMVGAKRRRHGILPQGVLKLAPHLSCGLRVGNRRRRVRHYNASS